MKADRFNLLNFFFEFIQLSIKYPGRTGWGNPCSTLIEAMILRQETFIKKIIDSDSDHNEYRLNGAGLKMYWVVDQGKFKCRIGGDQAKDYPLFVEAVTKFIHQRGASK